MTTDPDTVSTRPAPAQPNMTGLSKMIFALDVPGVSAATRFITLLGALVGYFKVGLQLMSGRDGVDIIDAVIASGGKVFLDLKLHDIPETVRLAAANAGLLRVSFLTIHACGGVDMMRSAVEGAASTNPDTRIMAITILTSQTPKDLRRLGIISKREFERAEQDETYKKRLFARKALKLARLAKEAGCHGVVCSPHETKALRKALGPEMLIINPGVRKAGAATHDQARAGTAAQAIRDGGENTFVVIGRPLRDADDPIEAAHAFAVEIEEALAA